MTDGQQAIEKMLLHHVPVEMSFSAARMDEAVCSCGLEMKATIGETGWMLMAKHQAQMASALFEVLTGAEEVRRVAILDAAKALEDHREWGGRYGQTRRRMNNAKGIAYWLAYNAQRIARREDPQ